MKNNKIYTKELGKALSILNDGKVLLYPTDTVWGIGCDATNEKAVQKIYKIKERELSKSLLVLVNSVIMLKQYIPQISKEINSFLKTNKSPTTILYNNPIGIAKNTIRFDNTIAIRMVTTGYAHDLINLFGKPIISTSANISNKKLPLNFNEIDEKILQKVDFIVKEFNEKINGKPSRIIKFQKGKIIVLRD